MAAQSNTNPTDSIVDRFGRLHTYLRISLTEKCNLRCTYCMPEEGVPLTPKPQLMQPEEILGIARIFSDLGVSKIRLTGGEPLVRKAFPEIALGLAKLPVSLCVTTNGILVDRHIDTFKEANIRQVNVSLDTLKEDRFATITKRDHFRQVRDNIDMLVREGFSVKVNVVLMKDFNEDEILDFIDWSAREAVHIRFIEFMPFNGNRWAWEKIYSNQEFMDHARKHFKFKTVASQAHDTARAYQVEGTAAGGTFGIISSMTNHFCGSCNRIRLTANGKLRNCLFAQGETDLLRSWRRGEDIRPLIQASFAAKHARHGGVAELQKLGEQQEGNRSMILIGG